MIERFSFCDDARRTPKKGEAIRYFARFLQDDRWMIKRMIEDMMVRNLSPCTQQSYVCAIAKFSRYFGCAPDR
ncbi:hypothetical protein [Bradyrhizobium murdochi]|uniref:hypothetical protein n=1 Tax=Bradyrhizobium murdochi TaxID=1038859 RepID=UPI00041D519E